MPAKKDFATIIDYSKCPKCGAAREFNTTGCSQCGIEFSKEFDSIQTDTLTNLSQSIILSQIANPKKSSASKTKQQKKATVTLCPACKQKITKKGPCPKCGLSPKKQKIKRDFTHGRTGRLFLMLFFVIFIKLFVIDIVGQLSEKTDKQQPHENITRNIQNNITSISKTDFGKSWPFTVSQGLLSCERGPILLFQTNGKTYGLNAFATENGYKNIDEIRLTHQEIKKALIKAGLSPEDTFPKVPLGPIIDKGLTLCLK